MKRIRRWLRHQYHIQIIDGHRYLMTHNSLMDLRLYKVTRRVFLYAIRDLERELRNA